MKTYVQKSLLALAVATGAWAVIPASAATPPLVVNIQAETAGGTYVYSGVGAYGGDSGTFWNGADGNGTYSNLLASDGTTVTSISIQKSQGDGAGGGQTADIALFGKNNYGNSTNAYPFTISGLDPAKTYDIYLYGSQNTDGWGTEFSINNGSPEARDVAGGNGSSFVAGDVISLPLVPSSNYVVFSGVVPTSGGVITGGWKRSAASGYGILNGFQIVESGAAKTLTTTTLESSQNPSIFGTEVTFTATIKVDDITEPAATGTVEFKAGTTTLAAAQPVTNGIATFSTSALAIGGHQITAIYSGDDSYQTSTSNTVSQTVISDVAPSTLVVNIQAETANGAYVGVGAYSGDSGIYWNNASGNGTYSNLLASDGTTVTSVSIQKSTGQGVSAGSGGTVGLFSGSNNYGNGQNYPFTIGGLNPAKTYDIYLYGQQSGTTYRTLFHIDNGSPEDRRTGATSAPATAFIEGDVVSNPYVLGSNYVLFAGVAPDESGNITGTWGTASAYGILNGFQIVEVNDGPLPDYQVWDNLYEADLSDKNADNDGDGMSNFEEYAFGLDPTSGASVNPITDLSTLKSAGTFSYTRRAGTGLTYSVWTSTDLVDWGTEPVLADQEAGPVVDGVETVLVTLPGIPSDPKFFVRVKAQ